jgi:hypothetical protein
MSLPIIINFNYEEEVYSIKNLQISKAYFINGLIKTNISWNKINDDRIKQYDIFWIESECHSDVFSCCYRRDAVTIQNYFQLYDLRYDCTYLINIKPIGSKLSKPFEIYFNVSSCKLTDVYGSIRPPCQTDRKTSKIYFSLIRGTKCPQRRIGGRTRRVDPDPIGSGSKIFDLSGPGP